MKANPIKSSNFHHTSFMLDAPQNYVQLWSATPISPWLLNLVFSSKSINNTLYLCWYDSCTRRYIYQHIFQPPVIKHTAALYWPMQLMLGYLMITISQWSYLIAVIISSSNPYKTTNLDMFYHGILGIFWMSKYFFENFWGNYIFIFTTFQNSKFQTFSLAIIDWPNPIFIRNKQIKSFLKYLSCIYIENQSTKMFLLRYQLQVCTYN